MVTHYTEEEERTPYRSLANSEQGEDQNDSDSETEQGGGLPAVDEDDVPQIPPNLETPNLPPQVPVPGEGRPGFPEPGPAVTPGMEVLQ